MYFTDTNGTVQSITFQANERRIRNCEINIYNVCVYNITNECCEKIASP